MKFAHLADIHLGYEQYNQPWRADDFARSFRVAAMKAIDADVDFAIVAGDLFHRSVPNPKTLRDAIEVLAVFKEHDVPVFAVEGNHDRSARGISAYHLLERLGLLHVLGFRKERIEGEHVTSERIENVYLVKGICDGVEIIGTGYLTRWRLEKVLPLLRPESDESVLVLHQAVKEVIDVELDMAYELTLKDLPKASYYALGHVHIARVAKRGDSYLVYPGAIERYDAREASQFVEFSDELRVREGVRKGFFLVNDFEPEFVEVETRNLINILVEAERRDEAEAKLSRAMKLAGSEDVVVARVRCWDDVDVRRLNELTSAARHVELRFERVREESESFELVAESEFFSEFELKLIELLREESDALRSAAIDLIREHFGLAEVRKLGDFKETAAKRETKEEERDVEIPKGRKPKTLFDFFGGGDAED